MADNVVQAFTLPKQTYPMAQSINDSIPNGGIEPQDQSSFNVLPGVVIDEEGVANEAIMATEMEPFVQPITVMPKTLQEIAEANPEIFQPVEDTSIPAVQPVTPVKPLQGRNPPRKRKQTPKSTTTKSTRRRKRPRSESSGSESQESGNEDSDAPPKSRRKRAPVAATPSTRVLRPRKLKSEEALRQEREKENAIESALLD